MKTVYFTLSLDGGHVTQQTPDNAVAPGEWLHASATWDGSVARIYVNDATADSPVFRGNQASTFYVAGFAGYAYPEGLVPGTTYYWRIDEVNEADPNSPWKGNIWSFWIPPRTAYEPTPADGINFVLPDAALNWTAGFGASLHQVYLGDNLNVVNVNSITIGIGTKNVPAPAGGTGTMYFDDIGLIRRTRVFLISSPLFSGQSMLFGSEGDEEGSGGSISIISGCASIPLRDSSSSNCSSAACKSLLMISALSFTSSI